VDHSWRGQTLPIKLARTRSPARSFRPDPEPSVGPGRVSPIGPSVWRLLPLMTRLDQRNRAARETGFPPRLGADAGRPTDRTGRVLTRVDAVIFVR
jgi:hypothetical protein